MPERDMLIPMPLPAIPPESHAAFAMLYGLENTLRELVIAELSTVYGARWYRKCLPPDLLKKYEEGLLYERQIPWSKLRTHHPLYYLDFPDLRKVITKKDNWRQHFQAIFKSEDVVNAQLSEVEVIRNKIAHNRLISTSDFHVMQGAWETVETCVGSDRVLVLLSRVSEYEDVSVQLSRLCDEVSLCDEAMSQFRDCPQPSVYLHAENSWWFDDGYLSTDLSSIRKFFEGVISYRAFERERGSGYKLEQWYRSFSQSGIVQLAVESLHIAREIVI